MTRTVWTYTNIQLQATLVDTFVDADGSGTKYEVLQATDGRFYILRDTMQVGPSYGSKQPACAKAAGAAYFGEKI
jgi:hypothetical protein